MHNLQFIPQRAISFSIIYWHHSLHKMRLMSAKSEGLLPPSRLRTVRVPFKTYSSSSHLSVCLYEISADLSCLMVLQPSCIWFFLGSSPFDGNILLYCLLQYPCTNCKLLYLLVPPFITGTFSFTTSFSLKSVSSFSPWLVQYNLTLKPRKLNLLLWLLL